MKQRIITLLVAILGAFQAAAAQQRVSGTVVDDESGVTLPYVNVVYQGRSAGGVTDENGNFSVPYSKELHQLVFSCVGYEQRVVNIAGPIKGLTVKMRLKSKLTGVVEVRGKRKRYSRKNNPAVELMRHVIAAKRRSDLSQHDFYQYQKYQKLTFALNEFTPKVLESDKFKKMPFLRDRVEVSPETGKLILPISVDETLSEHIFRKEPRSEKDIVKGHNVKGINDFFSTGDIMTTLIQDCFTDIDVYDNNVRLLQAQFVSPLSSSQGISFYRYFIQDTVEVNGARCYEVTFTPNNPQDFGFNGSLYVVADTSYRVSRVLLNLPHRSDVNFVSDLQVVQNFQLLPTGEQVLSDDKMIVQINVVGSFTKMHVKRATYYSDYAFEPIEKKEFKFLGNEKVLADAKLKSADFWNSVRPEKLSEKEATMDDFLQKMIHTRGFKLVLFVAKAFIENFVETSTDPKHPSKVDIGPINTIFSHNFVDGFRLRASAQTTAFLSPHWFLKGYVAYGFKDRRWKGMGELTYSFNKKDYLPREFPVRNLSVSYQNDVISPSDRFMPTDKDNVFTSFKWTDVHHMMYFENWKLKFDNEWGNGLRLTAQLQRERDEPTAHLFYRRLEDGLARDGAAADLRHITTADAKLTLRYQPGATYINTKQRRIPVNNDSPIFEVSHTSGIKGFLGSDYSYNVTQASVYKRFQLSSWGRIDTRLELSSQWNKVPFNLLLMPEANLSYIKEKNMFSLIRNMEFLNDRSLTFFAAWDLNGKLFNRVPLLRKLKWREYLGVNVLWGTLTKKNDPLVSQSADGMHSLFYFPGEYNDDGSFSYISHVMHKRTPYVEAVVGIHNIFKIVHIEYVRRLTYLDYPGVKRWGIRLMMRATF